jgi:hypothetical protein
MTLKYYTFLDDWNQVLDTTMDSENTLVLFFGTSNKELMQKPLQDITKAFSNSIVVGSSTAGEIAMDEIHDNSVVVAVLKFENTKLKLTTESIQNAQDSFLAGKKIASTLQGDKLKNIFILSDGLNVNGSQLTHGMNSILNNDVIVSGGLAGDGDRFESTWILQNQELKSHAISGVGFYGDSIQVAHAFKGGWDKFGIQRKVTKSVDNILYELDNKPALDIYKTYLANKAKDLPASGLLFPLELQEDKMLDIKTVRTILAVNEEEKSIIFAGDIPEGSFVSLMKANHDRLIEGAYDASKKLDLSTYEGEDILSIAISCIGRKLVLKQRVEDELEATLENLPKNTKQVGFYSYGEISPKNSGQCELHNQTMTLTLIWEKDAPLT